MAVETTQTFVCDNPRKCAKSSTDVDAMTSLNVTYRLPDGSSGQHATHFCGTHDAKVIATLRDLGVLPKETPDPVVPSKQTGAKKTAAKKTAAKKTTRSK